ncbi:MAG: FAD:protein FMN transferase [Bauldia sp.]
MKTSTEAAVVRYALNGPTMGTRFSAIFYAAGAIDLPRVQRDLQSAVDRVDAEMSSWKPTSDLNRFNGSPVGEWIDVPEALLKVVEVALDISEASSGAFEIGVGDAVEAWGFGASGKAPDPARIAVAEGARRPSFELVEVDPEGSRLRKSAPVRIDLSGIAKGFGVDELGRVLERHGVVSYLVSIDGEMRACGLKPDGSGWAIGIEAPDPTSRGAAGVVELDDGAVATSGDYRHSIAWKGLNVSHTIDPATGSPVANRLASVTVLARECIEADAWATVLMVMGEADGPAFALRHGIDALFLIRSARGIDELATGCFQRSAVG